MGQDVPEPPAAAPGRRRAALVAGALCALLIIAGVIGLVRAGTSDGAGPDGSNGTTETSAGSESPDITTPGGPSVEDLPEASPGEPDAAPADEQPVGSESGPRLAELTTAFPESGEVAVCAEAQRRLRVYAEVAATTSPGEFVTLRESMEEFEANLYTSAENHDWGDRMIEHLTAVRRMWATADSAQLNDDRDAAKAAAEDAAGALDAAIAVECPT